MAEKKFWISAIEVKDPKLEKWMKEKMKKGKKKYSLVLDAMTEKMEREKK